MRVESRIQSQGFDEMLTPRCCSCVERDQVRGDTFLCADAVRFLWSVAGDRVCLAHVTARSALAVMGRTTDDSVTGHPRTVRQG